MSTLMHTAHSIGCSICVICEVYVARYALISGPNGRGL